MPFSDAANDPARLWRHAAEVRQRISDRLAELVPAETDEPQQLHRAMRHSLLSSGKRIRPTMAVLITAHLGGNEDAAIDPACAIEMVHTASLMLDDLPSMDDATLRRGQAANHVVFGESTALLAALALLTSAYGVVGSAKGLTSELRNRLVSLLSDAVGSNGLIGGQMLDLEDWPGRDAASLKKTNMLKTASLFVACAEAEALIAGVPECEVRAVRGFARDTGLAFQIFDDLLDVSHTETEAGKNVEQDDRKVTLVSLIGSERARAWANDLLDSAANSLTPLGSRGESLVGLVQLLIPGASAAMKSEL